MRVHASLDLVGGQQVKNSLGHLAASAPSALGIGFRYYDTTLNQELYWNGSSYANKATDSLLLQGQNLAYTLSRGNHTGTQLAATISDFATTVRATHLDQFAAPTAPVSFNSQRLTGLGNATLDTDAATLGQLKGLVASAAAGIDAKASVRAKTSGNDTLSGLATRDGVNIVAGDRILVADQTDATQNGVYVAASGAWTRATDADDGSELTPGAFWFVEEGGQAKTQWRIENSGTIVVGSTSITINKFGAGAVYTASLGVQLVGNDIRAMVVVSGGIVVGATGLAIDTSIVPRWKQFLIGDGSALSFTVTHNLNNLYAVIQVADAAGNIVLADVQKTNANTAVVSFTYPPAVSGFVVTVIG